MNLGHVVHSEACCPAPGLTEENATGASTVKLLHGEIFVASKQKAIGSRRIFSRLRWPKGPLAIPVRAATRFP